MSQSRFSIVLVGVSALLRRPLVSRLRPADGERSPWVVFAARGGRFESGFRSVVGLRVHRFRFSARTASGLPSAGWFCRLPLRRLPLGRLVLPLGGLAFGLTTSAFRHSPLRSCPRRVGSSAFRFGDCHSAGWPSGSRLPLFGIRRSAPPCRRREGRRSTPTRHLFHFKTLIPTC